jgi:hypothetical protein
MKPPMRNRKSCKQVWFWLSTGFAVLVVVLLLPFGWSFVHGRLAQLTGLTGRDNSLLLLALFLAFLYGLSVLVSRFQQRYEEEVVEEEILEYREMTESDRAAKVAIVELLYESGSPATTAEIAAQLNVSAFRTGRLLVQMEGEGTVTRVDGGYRLSDTERRAITTAPADPPGD